MARSSNVAVLPRRPDAVSDRRDPTLPVILEFQWPSTAIANAPIPPSARGMTYVITSAVASMIALMALIPIDQVITATGIVVAASPTLLVQPLDTSIVRSIEIKDGQRVKAGQILARLDPTLAKADLAALAARGESLKAERERLRAEAAGTRFVYRGDDPDRSLQAAISGFREAEFANRMEQYNQKIREAEARVSRGEADVAGYRDRLGIATSVTNMRSKLEALQVGSRLNTLAAIDNRAEISRSLAAAKQVTEAARRDVAALTAEKATYQQNWLAELSQKLAENSRLLSDAQENYNKAKLHRQMVELRAERDATVMSIAKVSPGSVMQSGQQLITLVPDDARLEVEATVPGRDNGFVQLGNPAVIKFDTFPFTQYGMAKGEVRTISPNSFNPQEELRNPTTTVPISAANAEPFYRARVTLDEIDLHGVPADFHLMPGMPVKTDIKIGERTIMSYFLSQMLSIAKEGMREP